jgi:hypothetical protein
VVVERRDALRRKYLSLGVGELAATAAFGVVAVTAVGPRFGGPRGEAALWSALVPLLLVLVQAGVYWLSARRWVGRAPMPAIVAAFYRVFRVVDPLVLAVGLSGVLLSWPCDSGAALTVMGVWFFGLAEYLNYFVVRLSYPINRWSTMVRQWRRPRLVQDLDTSVR